MANVGIRLIIGEFQLDIMNGERQGKLGHVVQIHVYPKLDLKSLY